MAQGPRHLHDSFVSSGLRKTAQELSAAEKAQARTNIGAVGADGDTINNVGLTGNVSLATTTEATSAGDVDIAGSIVKITTGASGLALGLIDGAEGQLLLLLHIVDGGGDATLTPGTGLGFTTITFSAVGQSALLYYSSNQGWSIVALNGAVAA